MRVFLFFSSTPNSIASQNVSVARVPAEVSHCRKKKKKSHSSAEHARLADKEQIREQSDEGEEARPRGSGPGEAGGGRQLTEAERRFEETQRQRVRLHVLASFEDQLIGYELNGRGQRGPRSLPR